MKFQGRMVNKDEAIKISRNATPDLDHLENKTYKANIKLDIIWLSPLNATIKNAKADMIPFGLYCHFENEFFPLNWRNCLYRFRLQNGTNYRPQRCFGSIRTDVDQCNCFSISGHA